MCILIGSYQDEFDSLFWLQEELFIIAASLGSLATFSIVYTLRDSYKDLKRLLQQAKGVDSSILSLAERCNRWMCYYPDRHCICSRPLTLQGVRKSVIDRLYLSHQVLASVAATAQQQHNTVLCHGMLNVV